MNPDARKAAVNSLWQTRECAYLRELYATGTLE